MIQRMALGLLVLWCALQTFAQAQPTAPTAPAELTTDLPGSQLRGQGRLTFMTLRVYEARLWTAASPAGATHAVPADWGSAVLALELIYQRGLSGAKIAERSLTEMQRQGDIEAAKAARWLAAMKQTFPDVKEGDRLTGINLPGLGVRFYFNGKLLGDVRDAEFARLFFGIWLSPKTSEPGLRDALLGKPS